MRQIIVKYNGECTRCGNILEVGNPAMYEKSMGIFCVGCEPKEVEDIREFRQAKADTKAARREVWAESARRESDRLAGESFDMMSAIPMGQPILIGHHSERRDRNYRERAWNKMGKSVELRKKADYHKQKAESLRHVQVKGDAERAREEKRKAQDLIIKKGSRVYDFAFREGTVTRVNKKTYTVKFDSGGTYARDKTFMKLTDYNPVYHTPKEEKI